MDLVAVAMRAAALVWDAGLADLNGRCCVTVRPARAAACFVAP
jgi:hypothetical protein